MEAIPNLITVLLFVLAVVYLIYSEYMVSTVPQSVPWAGCRNEVLSRTRACIRELTAGLRTLESGYNQFSRKGLPCVLPDFGFRPIVMVPQEQIVWMGDKPVEILSVLKAHQARFALNYLAPDVDFNHDAHMMGAIRKDLTRNLGTLQPAIIQDIRDTIDDAMGLDTECWNDVCVSKAMGNVIFRATSRVLVGSSLCQNQEYLHHLIAFAEWLGGGSILVGQYTPWMIKPFLGYLMALAVYYHKRKSMKFLRPVIGDRMANMKRKRADPSFEFEEPNDLITWMTQAILDDNETEDSPPDFIGNRILFIVVLTKTNIRSQTLGAIHTTITTATNTFLDLASSDPDAGFWEQLREEAQLVFKTADDWNSPASLLKLPLADSAVRESLRKNPVVTRVILREVMAKDGIQLPSGHHIPRGALMGADTVGLHHDDRFYPKADEYDPFRFARKQEITLEGSNEGTLTDKASIYRKNQGLTTASDIFLSFGYGKHSCPGRWLVANQLKLMLAYITLNYDIQHMAKRPVNHVFGDSIVPPPTATMMVRRRKHT